MGPFRPRVKKLLTPDEVPDVEMVLRTAVISDAQEDKGMCSVPVKQIAQLPGAPAQRSCENVTIVAIPVILVAILIKS